MILIGDWTASGSEFDIQSSRTVWNSDVQETKSRNKTMSNRRETNTTEQSLAQSIEREVYQILRRD